MNIKLRKIKYAELDPRQKEVFNFHKIAGCLADYGFDCIRLTSDWQGTDFVAYHKDGSDTLKVQLKARVCIGKKYMNKSLYMVFPIHGAWYLIEHDKLVALIRKHTTWLTSVSWQERGGYSSASPNSRLVAALESYKIWAGTQRQSN